MRYLVTAGYVTVETAVSGTSRARIDVPRGAELPADVPAAEAEALLRRGDVQAVDEPQPEPPADPDAVPTGTIQVVLDWVGDDKDKAQGALAAEQAAASPRSTLVDTLQKLLAAGE